MLNLKGFTITANSSPGGSLISLGFQQTASNTFPITIKNGTLMTAGPSSSTGINAISNDSAAGVCLTDVTVDKVVITGRGGLGGLSWQGIAFSTISNCSFIGEMDVALEDRTALGNAYLNDTFEGPDENIAIRASNITLSRANFSGDPAVAATTTTTDAAALARTVKISSLPFNITAPGTYVLAGNLDVTTAGGINISTALAGPVVLDLKGFTLLGNLQFQQTAISIGAPLSTGVSNTFPITIRNGTVKYCLGGLSPQRDLIPPTLSNLTVHDIDFIQSNVFFERVASSLVSGCTFDNSNLTDLTGGNRYRNDIFLNLANFRVGGNQGGGIVDRCVFADTRPQN